MGTTSDSSPAEPAAVASTLGEKKANSQALSSRPCRIRQVFRPTSPSQRKEDAVRCSAREKKGFHGAHATSYAFHTSFPVAHIARAADSLPAAGEPVWYPCHAGSRGGGGTP